MNKKKIQIPPGAVEATLCTLLAGKPDVEFKRKVGPFPYALKVVRANETSSPLVLKIENNTASVVGNEYVAGYLREYVSYLSGSLSSYNVPFKRCQAVVESWVHQQVDLTALPKPVAFRSDPELAMSRLDFDPIMVPPGELPIYAPKFYEMLGRVKSNAKALVMRIGSMFDANADRKQAVWLWGPRDAGKSQFSWLLEVLSGGSYAILAQEQLKRSFWKVQLVGKRIALVQEAPAKFIRSDGFKAITGDGRHPIEDKHEKVYVANVTALLFLFSNEAPELPHDDALITRIIDCRIDAVGEEERRPESELRTDLINELPAIVGHCLAAYEEIASGMRIPCDRDELDETVSQFEADYLDLIEAHFVTGLGDDAFVMRTDVQELVKERFGPDPSHQHRCKRILKKRYNCGEKKRPFRTLATEKDASNFKRLYVYTGIRKRTPEEMRFVNSPSDLEKSNVVTIGSGFKSPARV